MSSRRRGIRDNKQSKIDFSSLNKFLRLIGAMAGGLMVIGLLGLMAAGDNISSRVVYMLVIGFNAVVFFGSYIAVKLFSKRVPEQGSKSKSGPTL